MKIKSILVALLLLTLGAAFTLAPNASASTSDNAPREPVEKYSPWASLDLADPARTPQGVTLSWSDSDEDTVYEIWQRDVVDRDFELIGKTRGNTFLDRGRIGSKLTSTIYDVKSVDETKSGYFRVRKFGRKFIHLAGDLRTPWLSDAAHFHGNTYLVSNENTTQNVSDRFGSVGTHSVSVYLDGEFQRTVEQNYESQRTAGPDEIKHFPFEVTVPDDGKSHVVHIYATNRDFGSMLHKSGKSNTLTIPARSSGN